VEDVNDNRHTEPEVAIFPTEASVIRPVGAVLADIHDEWQAGDPRHLSESSTAKLYPDRETVDLAELTPATDSEEHLKTTTRGRLALTAEPHHHPGCRHAVGRRLR